MIVGRSRELHQLQDTLARVAHDAGSVVVLAGEAGVGKSHLLDALVELARERGFGVAVGRCFADTAGQPYGPWREALGAVVASREASLGAGDDRARAFEAALSALQTRASERPLVVALEDVHWADRDSLLLLQHVARFGRASALLLAVTVRTPDLDAAQNETLDRVLAELARGDRCERLSLRPFAEPEVAEYARSVAGAEVPQSLAGALHAETGGNAFYVRELLRHLMERGDVARTGGRLVTHAAVAELGLPPSVRGVVRERVARLSAAAVSVLRCASAAGVPLELGPLSRAAGLDAGAALDALDEAIASGTVRAVGGRYELAHALVRRAIYEELNPGRRAQLHRRLAEALQEHGAADRAEVAGQFHASRELPGAEAGVPHALAAAGAAVAAGAHAQAVTLLAMALDLAATLPPSAVADVATRLAVARAVVADVEGALTAARRAVEALTASGDPAGVAASLTSVVRALEEGGAPRTEWEPLVRQGLAALGDRRDLTWARLALLERGVTPLIEGPVWVSYFAGHDPEAVRLLRAEGTEIDFAATVEPHQARPPEESAALRERARRWSEPAAALRVLDACGRDLFFRGDDLHRTVASTGELLALAERVGSMSGTVSALVVLGCCHAALGDLAAARAVLARSKEIGARLGAMHRMNLVGPLAVQTVIGYVAGADWSAMVPRLIAFVSSPQAGQAAFSIVPLSLGLVGSAFLGDVGTAEALVPLHLRALEGLPTDYREWGATRDCGSTVVWRLGLREYAPRYLALAGRDAAVAGSACWSCVEESAARMTALLGDLDGARALFDRARERFESSGRRPMLGVCDHDEALAMVRNGLGDDARVASLLDRADARFTALGMGTWLDATKALRASIAAGPSPAPDGLTPRELEVLVLLAGGMANKEIAARLFISMPTVERHVANIYGKTGQRGRAAATAYALRRGLLGG